MALVKAVAIGAVAALAIPYVIRGGSGQLVEWLHYGLVRFSLSGLDLAWSWPIFCVVTLFAWGALAWSNK